MHRDVWRVGNDELASDRVGEQSSEVRSRVGVAGSRSGLGRGHEPSHVRP
jgi:hypothetical protein